MHCCLAGSASHVSRQFNASHQGPMSGCCHEACTGDAVVSAEVGLLPVIFVHRICPKILFEGLQKSIKKCSLLQPERPFLINTMHAMYDVLPRPIHAPCFALCMKALASPDLVQSLLLVISPSCSCCHSGPELLNWSVEAQLPNSLLDLLHLLGALRTPSTAKLSLAEIRV